MQGREIDYRIRNKVLIRDGNKCRYCGSTNQPFHMDHVYPFSRGGETSIDNLVTSCAKCNHSKGAKIGMFPKPIGYFDAKPKEIPSSIIISFSIMLLGVGIFMTPYSSRMAIEYITELQKVLLFTTGGFFVFIGIGILGWHIYKS